MRLIKYIFIVSGLAALVFYINNTTDQNTLATLAALITAAGIALAVKA